MKKSILTFGADRGRFGHASLAPAAFADDMKKDTHDQGHHVEGLDEKGRRHVEGQMARIDEERRNEEGRRMAKDDMEER